MAGRAWTFILLLPLLGCRTPVLGVKEDKIGIQIHPDSLSVVAERKAPFLLNCSVTSDPEFGPLNFTWLKDGQVVEENSKVKILQNGSLHFKRIVHKKHKRARSPDKRPGRSDSGWYECYARNKIGKIFVRRVQLEVSEIGKKFESRPERQTQPVGGVARFHCHLDGVRDPHYVWEKVGDNSPDGPRFKKFSGILQIQDVQYSDAGHYRCLHFHASADLKMSTKAELIVQGVMQRKRPRIVAGPANITVNVNLEKTALLECLAEGNPKPDITWRRADKSPISRNAKKSLLGNLEFHDLSARDEGLYICIARNSVGFDSKSAFLEVNVPPVINTLPTSERPSYAMDIPVKCDATGKPTPSLRWLKDGKELENGSRIWIDYNGRLLVREGELEDSGYYQCIVNNSAGYATTVSRVSIFSAEGSPTNPPTDVKAIVISETDVRLTWSPPTGPSPQSLSYTITRNIVDETDNLQAYYNVELTKETSLTLMELKPYTTFSFHVRAWNTKGASPASKVVYAKTMESVPTTYPKIVELDTPTPNSILVSWKPLTVSEARGRVDHYTIFYRWLDNTKNAKVSPEKSNHTLTHLKPATKYSILVVGATAKGYPPIDLLGQPWQHATTRKEPVKRAIFTLSVSRLNNTAIIVRWNLLTNEEELAGFKLIVETAVGDDQLGPFSIPPSVKSYTITNLENNTWYEVTLEAFSKNGDSWTETKDAFTRSPVDLPPPPRELDGTPINSSSIVVKWNPPSTDVKIVSYTINYTVSKELLGDKPNLTNSKVIHSQSGSVLISGLKPYTSYRISVQSHTTDSAGDFSNPIIVKTAEDLPSAPEDVKGSIQTPTEVRISWNPPKRENGKILYYEVFYTAKQKEDWRNISHNGSSRSQDVKKLYKKEYLFKVRAVTVKGEGNFSDVILVVTPGHSTLPPISPGPVSEGGESSFDKKLVVILCLVVAVVIIIVCVVVVVRYKCFNTCSRGNANISHRPPVCAGNGNLNHHNSGNHANGHAVQVPRDGVPMETYIEAYSNMLQTLPEPEHVDAKGGGNLVLVPGGYKNGITLPTDYHNGHMHNNRQAVEEDHKVREPLLSGCDGGVVSGGRSLGDSLEDIDHGEDVSHLPEDADLDDSSTPLVAKSARGEARSPLGITTSPSDGVASHLRRGENLCVTNASAEPVGIGTPSNQGSVMHADSGQEGVGQEARLEAEPQAGGGAASVATGPQFSGSSSDEPPLPLLQHQSNQTSHYSPVGETGGTTAPPFAPPTLVGSTSPPSNVTITSTSLPHGSPSTTTTTTPAAPVQQPHSLQHTSNLSDKSHSQRLQGTGNAPEVHSSSHPGISATAGDLPPSEQLSLKPNDLSHPSAAMLNGTAAASDDQRPTKASA